MTIGFVGAGKVGKALGLYFKNHNLSVAGYCSRTPESVQNAAHITNTEYFDSVQSLASACQLIFITTPDQALKEIDSQVSSLLTCRSIDPRIIWIHTSGAFPSGCLAGIKSAGCPVGSMHPLQSFADPLTGAQLLENTLFSAEGTPEALQAIKMILCKTGGKYGEISPGRKPLYHAGACVISNYLVTLIDSGMRLMEAAGMDRKTLFQSVRPLIDGTLQNIQEKGTVSALSGPIVRGDIATVSEHLRCIDSSAPEESECYRELGLKTVSMIEGQRLGQNQAKEFKTVLKRSCNHER